LFIDIIISKTFSLSVFSLSYSDSNHCIFDITNNEVNRMSSERSISPDPLPRSHSRSSVANDEKESNGHRQASSSSNSQKRRRDNSK